MSISDSILTIRCHHMVKGHIILVNWSTDIVFVDNSRNFYRFRYTNYSSFIILISHKKIWSWYQLMISTHNFFCRWMFQVAYIITNFQDAIIYRKKLQGKRLNFLINPLIMPHALCECFSKVKGTKLTVLEEKVFILRDTEKEV